MKLVVILYLESYSMNMIRYVYVKLEYLLIILNNGYRFWKFIWEVYKSKVFTHKKSEDVLTIISILLCTESKYYDSKKIMNRNNIESYKLLEALIKKYRETKSEVILNQVLEVLKEEVIKRG